MRAESSIDQDQAPTGFAIPEAWKLVRDLMTHNPAIYFIDFTLSVLIAYGAIGIYFTVPDFSLTYIVMFVIGTFSLFRAGIFIHEVVHIPRGRLEGFKVYWNIVYGIVMLSPSFMYSNHSDHHARPHYGTGQDGEYQPFAHGNGWRIFRYFGQVVLIPIFAVVRFLILAPLAWIFPPVRKWVWENASSYISNFGYKRQVPEGEDHRAWVLWEVACFAWVAFLAVLLATRTIPIDYVIELYVLVSFVLFWNWLRNLAGHLFLSTGDAMSHEAQFQESVTITGAPWFHELLFPVGLRYHAIHHLFPAMPYHRLPEAHRRLMQLPESAGYRGTLYRSIFDVFAILRANMRTNRTGQTQRA